MQNEQPKIDFFRRRESGEKITATIDFIRENSRMWLRWCVLPLLPLCAILGWLTASHTVEESPYGPFLWDLDLTDELVGFSFKNESLFAPFTLVTAVVLLLIFTVTGALMYLYQYREQRLKGVKWDELLPALKHAFPGAAAITVAGYFILFFLGSATFSLQVLLLLAFLSLALYAPTCHVGCYPPHRAFGHSLSLGVNTWAGTFLVTLGLLLILLFIRSVPDALMSLLDSYLSGLVFYNSFNNDVYNIILIAMNTLQYWVAFACFSVLLIGAGYQYGHAEEKFSSVSLYEDVRHFDEI